MNTRLSDEAQADIFRIEAFWAEKRPKNPLLFREQLQEALDIMEVAPKLGNSYVSTRTGKIYRKWPLLKTRDVVYFEYFEDQELLAIVTIRSPVAGDPPP